MKNKGFENTRRLYWNEIKKEFSGKVPFTLKFNIWLFGLLLPKRRHFYMQQVVLGYKRHFAFTRSIEWSKQQIINWQKERS